MANSYFHVNVEWGAGTTFRSFYYTLDEPQVIQPSKPPRRYIDLPTTIEECHKELDIIRGIVPTPKGYIVDPNRVKALMIRIKELS